MAKAKRSGTAGVIVALIVILIAVAGTWGIRRHRAAQESGATAAGGATASAIHVDASRVDPANEGKIITLHGQLDIGQPASDRQLGVSSDAVALYRIVMMRQWLETCPAGGPCRYEEVWSDQPIHSAKFKEPAGHQNPEKMPFRSARFTARELKIGAYRISAALLASDRKPAPYPVTVAKIAPNLAATFRDNNGALYSGNDPAHAQVGDLQVVYRIVPGGEVTVTGVQRGDAVIPAPKVTH
ncbi:MAG: TMEM43 family protein [Lysobacterales bacterium]